MQSSRGGVRTRTKNKVGLGKEKKVVARVPVQVRACERFDGWIMIGEAKDHTVICTYVPFSSGFIILGRVAAAPRCRIPLTSLAWGLAAAAG